MRPIRRPRRSRRPGTSGGGGGGGPATVRTCAKPAARHMLCSASMVGTYQLPKSVRSELPAWNCSRASWSRPLHVHRLGLDHRHLLGDGPEPFEAGQRLLHVVQHSEVEHDVELPEPVEVDGLEVGDDGLHLGAERGGGELEAATPREVRLPEVGLVARLVREDALLDALGPIGPPGQEVDAPRVMVERHHPAGTGPLGEERELAVPGADVEHTPPRDLGEDLGPGRLHADALGDDAVAQVDRVVPLQGVGLRLQLRW